MILLFFLLLMLALAWGVADHLQAIMAATPPPQTPSPIVNHQAVSPPPAIVPAATQNTDAAPPEAATSASAPMPLPAEEKSAADDSPR
jgi:hypothetical protein